MRKMLLLTTAMLCARGALAATAATQGCEISVGGQVVAILPNGAPGGQPGDFVAATQQS